eukprot:763676-Prorocentrum_minimum.AAC.4
MGAFTSSNKKQEAGAKMSEPVSTDIKTYKVQMRPANNNNWPRNGSLLKGTVYNKGGEQWLKVTEIQQSGTQGFENVDGQGKWMGFDGGPFNGGKWLHDI